MNDNAFHVVLIALFTGLVGATIHSYKALDAQVSHAPPPPVSASTATAMVQRTAQRGSDPVIRRVCEASNSAVTCPSEL